MSGSNRRRKTRCSLAVELPGIAGIMCTDWNCYVSYNQYSSDLMNYTMFLCEAKYHICFCVFTEKGVKVCGAQRKCRKLRACLA